MCLVCSLGLLGDLFLDRCALFVVCYWFSVAC